MSKQEHLSIKQHDKLYAALQNIAVELDRVRVTLCRNSRVNRRSIKTVNRILELADNLNSDLDVTLLQDHRPGRLERHYAHEAVSNA